MASEEWTLTTAAEGWQEKGKRGREGSNLFEAMWINLKTLVSTFKKQKLTNCALIYLSVFVFRGFFLFPSAACYKADGDSLF